MSRRFFIFLLLTFVLIVPAGGETIKWVDFDIPEESLRYAMEIDIDTAQKEQHINWIDILSVAACRTGGKCGLSSVKKAADQLLSGAHPEEILGDLYRYYSYYTQSYQAALGGLLGNFSIEANGQIQSSYGLKAFSPIASGYSYTHYPDFGKQRTFGFSRKHLGNDLLGALGTPVVAVEGGIVEALGWNRYGGWRVGVRSFDGKRYYYYAHLQKDTPFAPGLAQGDLVQAGDLLGFMGRTGYSDRENVNNIETVHLHFGMQLVFDESQKESNSEIWINVYPIVRLLNAHRSSLQKTAEGWSRRYPFVDLDIAHLPMDTIFVK